jgi:hypothetical protein
MAGEERTTGKLARWLAPKTAKNGYFFWVGLELENLVSVASVARSLFSKKGLEPILVLI